MRLRLPLALAAFLLLPLPGLAKGARIRVLVEALERSPGSPLREFPMPWPRATDATGRRFEGDEEGFIDLNGATGEVRIELDSRHVRVRREEQAFGKLVDPRTTPGIVTFTEEDAPLGARMCRVHLERARRAIVAALPPSAAGNSWFESPVLCAVDYDDGCNAAWDGEKIALHRGGPRCAPASHVADIIYHEYGHGAFGRVLPRNLPPDTRLNEGLGDLVAALITDDPRFAVGLWRGRAMSWMRDLSLPRAFPADDRGTYSAALTYSTAWWKIRQALSETLPPRSASEITLRAILLSLSRARPDSAPSALQSAAIEGPAAIADVAPFVADARCLGARVFAEHGFVPAEPGCPAAELRIAQTGPGSLSVFWSSRFGELPEAEARLSVEYSPWGEGTASARTASLRVHLPRSGASAEHAESIALPSNAPCGIPLRIRASAFTPRGAWLASAEARAVPGADVANPAEREIRLMKSGSSRLLADGSPQGPGKWLSLRVPGRLDPGWIPTGATLSLATNHPLPDDLAIAWASPEGETREFFKGVEEIPLPAEIEVPEPERFLNRPGGSLLIRDLSFGIRGSVTGASLRLRAAPLNCASGRPPAEGAASPAGASVR